MPPWSDPAVLLVLALVAATGAGVVLAARSLGRSRSRRRALLFCVATSVFACSVTAMRHAPRVGIWRQLELPSDLHLSPETFRASDAIRQYEDLSAPISNPLNRVLRWRLLLPVLARLLHLDAAGYLALAHVGCLLVVGLAAWVVWRGTGDRRATLGAALLAAGTSWFFSSTGWLGYFDSWCILALVAASLCPSRVVLAVACVLAPWVDERFTLSLPFVLAIAALPLVGGAGRGARAWAAAAGLATVAGLQVFVADISRSMSVLVPAGVLGAVLLVRSRPVLGRFALVLACALNLSLPARHVLTGFDVAIGSVATEVGRWRQTPWWLEPRRLRERAAVVRAEGRLETARRYEEAASALERR